MGETRDEIVDAMQDLHDAGCDILTITQYLRPSAHHPIDRWVKPKEFVKLSKVGYDMGSAGIMATARTLVLPLGIAMVACDEA